MRTSFSRAPRALWVCMLLAFLNASAWAVTTPPFQVIDEISHTGYVQYVAETRKLPRPISTAQGAYNFGEEQGAAIYGVPFSIQATPAWLELVSDSVRDRLGRDLDREHEPGAGAAANNPPLYYVLEAVPYTLARGTDFLDRVIAMRLFSALFFGLTVGFVFLFLRELLPGTRWAWTVGALAVAFQPVAASTSGGVNPDSLLWAACAALFWLLMRALRRGLTPGLGLAIGASLAVGLLTKAAMLGVLPGAAVGLLLAIVLAQREHRRRAWLGAVVAGVVGIGPFVAYTILTRLLIEVPPAAATAVTGSVGNLGEQASYFWQFFLPRLPFMTDAFTGYPDYPLWQTYYQGFVGRFGYFSYGFPEYVYGLSLIPLVALLGLVQSGITRSWGTLKQRKAQVATCLTLLLGTVLLVGVAGYRFRLSSGLNFEQPRYLFPVLALYGALVAVAARGGGRFGPAVGAVLVVGAMTHNLLALLLTLARYYS